MWGVVVFPRDAYNFSYNFNVEHTNIYDVLAGFNFDLRKLIKTDGYYLIVSNSTNHNYYINVCEGVSNTACSSDTARHIGVCQMDRNK